jgi:hypothetical protein
MNVSVSTVAHRCCYLAFSIVFSRVYEHKRSLDRHFKGNNCALYMLEIV